MRNRTTNPDLLRQVFASLLDQELTEQAYQESIEKNTALVPREFVQNHGIHCDVVFRKFPLGNEYTTDFFYLSKSSGDWYCVLIEIEKPQSRYFKDGSTKFHRDFQTALEQINHWRAWFSNPANFNGFVNGTLGQMLGTMRQNPCSIKYVLVHGRRNEFEGNDDRTRLIRGQERDDFHILSYDSLMESLHSKDELYIAVKKNDHIDILNRTFISEYAFMLLPSSYLRITEELRKSALDNRHLWHTYSVESLRKPLLDGILAKIGIIPETVTP